MERERDPRDRQRESLERAHEQAKLRELAPEERSFVARSIWACESRGKAAPSAAPPSERPRNLEEQFQKDLEVLKSIPALQPDNWAGLKVRDRLPVLEDVERRLAAAQGRFAHELTVLFSNQFQGISEVRERVDEKGRAIWSRDAGLTPRELQQIAEERFIHLNEQLLIADDPAVALGTLLEEARHNYQRAAITNPMAHPEADAKWLQKMEEGARRYEEDFKKGGYASNALEVDVDTYVKRMISELYG